MDDSNSKKGGSMQVSTPKRIHSCRLVVGRMVWFASTMRQDGVPRHSLPTYSWSSLRLVPAPAMPAPAMLAPAIYFLSHIFPKKTHIAVPKALLKPHRCVLNSKMRGNESVHLKFCPVELIITTDATSGKQWNLNMLIPVTFRSSYDNLISFSILGAKNLKKKDRWG